MLTCIVYVLHFPLFDKSEELELVFGGVLYFVSVQERYRIAIPRSAPAACPVQRTTAAVWPHGPEFTVDVPLHPEAAVFQGCVNAASHHPTPQLHPPPCSREPPSTTWTDSAEGHPNTQIPPDRSVCRFCEFPADHPTFRDRAAPKDVAAPPPSAVAARTFMNLVAPESSLDGSASPSPPLP